MDRIYTMKTIITVNQDSTLLNEEDLSHEDYNDAICFLRKFTGLWTETVYNGLPCFTCTDTTDGIEKIIFE